MKDEWKGKRSSSNQLHGGVEGEAPTALPAEGATQAHGVDVAGIVGGIARRVPDHLGRSADSMLAVYKQRFTYTFIFENEVASIHYDEKRKEIFFRGRNVKFMELSPAQQHAFWDLAEVLAQDREGMQLLAGYRETLAHLFADTR